MEVQEDRMKLKKKIDRDVNVLMIFLFVMMLLSVLLENS